MLELPDELIEAVAVRVSLIAGVIVSPEYHRTVAKRIIEAALATGLVQLAPPKQVSVVFSGPLLGDVSQTRLLWNVPKVGDPVTVVDRDDVRHDCQITEIRPPLDDGDSYRATIEEALWP